MVYLKAARAISFSYQGSIIYLFLPRKKRKVTQENVLENVVPLREIDCVCAMETYSCAYVIPQRVCRLLTIRKDQECGIVNFFIFLRMQAKVHP